MSNHSLSESPYASSMKWTLGRYIEILAARKGWSLYELSKRLGVSNTYVYQIVNGPSGNKSKPPSISVDILLNLSKTLGVTELALIRAYKGLDPEPLEQNQQALQAETVYQLIEGLVDLAKENPSEFRKAVDRKKPK